jgi:hypothetical protein
MGKVVGGGFYQMRGTRGPPSRKAQRGAATGVFESKAIEDLYRDQLRGAKIHILKPKKCI